MGIPKVLLQVFRDRGALVLVVSMRTEGALDLQSTMNTIMFVQPRP